MRWPPLHTPLLIPPPHPASHKWGHGAWDGSSLEGGPSCSGRTRQPAKDLVELKGWWIYIATYTENERTLLPLLVIAAAVPHPPVRMRSLLPKAGLLLLATTPRCRQTRARAHRHTHTHTQHTHTHTSENGTNDTPQRRRRLPAPRRRGTPSHRPFTSFPPAHCHSNTGGWMSSSSSFSSSSKTGRGGRGTAATGESAAPPPRCA